MTGHAGRGGSFNILLGFTLNSAGVLKKKCFSRKFTKKKYTLIVPNDHVFANSSNAEFEDSEFINEMLYKLSVEPPLAAWH